MLLILLCCDIIAVRVMKLFTQNYFKYGLIMSGLSVGCLFLMQVTDQKPGNSPINIFLTFLAPLAVWFFAILAKKKELNNTLSFKQGVKEAFKISLVYAIVSPFIFMFFYLFINPSWIQFIRETYQMKSANDATVIVVDMGAQFVSAIIGGTIYGAIISFFLKSKTK